MERRAALFVTILVALASVENSVATADNAVGGVVELGDDFGVEYDVEELLQMGDAPGKIKTVVVPVQAAAVSAPDPTIETLTPKHIRKQTARFKANNGKAPTGLEKMEVKRLAIQSAANEINQGHQAKDALEIAKQKESRLVRRIKRDKETIDKVSQNEEYAARKAYSAADRQVKYLETKANHHEFKAEEETNKLAKEKQLTLDAYKKRMKTKEEILSSKERHLQEQAKVDADNNAVMKARTVVAKARSTVEESRDIVAKRKEFLNNIEAHEADARLEYRQAKIQKEFEEDDALKVGLLLKRLAAKQRAVFKFTKSLDMKSQRDFRASEAGIDKAKGDFALAKGMYDKYTKKSGKFEKKLKKTQAFVELAKKGVVQGIGAGKDSMAIKNAENYARLKKRARKDKGKVDKMDIKARGQNKMMGAAMSELAKSEALETAARAQKDLVKQHRITMRTQMEKIEFLKNEVRKHKEKAEEADKRAKSALHRLKTMRKKAIREKREAVARSRYAKNIDLPMGMRAKKKADEIMKRDRFNEKSEEDNIGVLQREGREYYLQARKMRKSRDATAELAKKAQKRSEFARNEVTTAELKRDKTLAHNKKKIRDINARLAKAEKTFAAARASAGGKSRRKRRSAKRSDEELGESRHRHRDDKRPRDAPQRFGRRYGRRVHERRYRHHRRYRRGRARGFHQLDAEDGDEADVRYSADSAGRGQ